MGDIDEMDDVTKVGTAHARHVRSGRRACLPNALLRA
jgi:hypothetical protein